MAPAGLGGAMEQTLLAASLGSSQNADAAATTGLGGVLTHPAGPASCALLALRARSWAGQGGAGRGGVSSGTVRCPHVQAGLPRCATGPASPGA